MDDRKYYILGAILKSYINSAEPIGSRTLQRNYDMNVSAATIRNEMSDLEHLGYLMKEHTSSGRVPSALAYRWYVDELVSRGIAEKVRPVLGNQSLLNQSTELVNILDNAVQMLLDSNDYVAFYVLPGRTEDVLKQIRLIPLSDKELVLVTIYNTKVIQTELIHLQKSYSSERVERTGEIFQEILGNRYLADIDNFLNSQFFNRDSNFGNLIFELIPFIKKQIRKNLCPQIEFKGLNRVYELAKNSSAEKIGEFLNNLQHGTEFLELASRHQDGKPVEIYIGREMGIPDFENVTAIMSSFHVSGGLIGKIGVLGPLRMNYAQVLSDVGMIGRYIDSIATRS